MGSKIILAALWVLILNVSAYALQTLEHETVIWVEPGDTYLGLFGDNWMKVYQANNNIRFYNNKGKPASPDKLVVGQKLNVPAHTHLTRLAMEKLSRYEKHRNSAMKAIQEAASLKNKIQHAKSVSYLEAAALLRKAEEAAKGQTSGFKNYIEARIFAQEASSLFRITEERLAVKKTFEVIAGVVLIIFSGFIGFSRYKKRKARVRYIASWIKGHQKKLDKLRNSEKVSIDVTNR